MKRVFWILFVSLLVVSFVFPLRSPAEEKKEGEEIYTIKQGDTLWDISAKFLKDPFLWPKLWYRNPYITNPHWIYPGQPVRIVPPEKVAREAPKEPLKEPEVKKEEPPPAEPKPAVPEVKVEAKPEAAPPEAKPEVKPVEIKPLEEKIVEEEPWVFPEVRSAGFVDDIRFRGVGVIIDNKDGKNLLSEGDIVYLAFRTSDPVMVGNKYTIFRPVKYVRDPATNRKIGMRYLIAGNVQVIDQKGNFYTGKIIESFDAVVVGDMLRPYLKDK